MSVGGGNLEDTGIRLQLWLPSSMRSSQELTGAVSIPRPGAYEEEPGGTSTTRALSVNKNRTLGDQQVGEKKGRWGKSLQGSCFEGHWGEPRNATKGVVRPK